MEVNNKMDHGFSGSRFHILAIQPAFIPAI